MPRIVVGVSGASGIALSYKAVRVLAEEGYEVDLVMSKAACYTALLEMGSEYASPEKLRQHLPEELRDQVIVHSPKNHGATVGSGTFRTEGMLLIPCSMSSLAAIACGLADNLLRRAADVTLKERRRLVIVPRECPLSEIHLENMLRLTRAGAIIVPPVPAWYNGTSTLEDVENFIVGRSLEALGIYTNLYKRWDPQACMASAPAES